MECIPGAQFFAEIDVEDAYRRIRIAEGNEWKTAFLARYGHFEYAVTPFGLTNAPAPFQNYIRQSLQGLVNTVCIVYLDDFLISPKTREEAAEASREDQAGDEPLQEKVPSEQDPAREEPVPGEEESDPKRLAEWARDHTGCEQLVSEEQARRAMFRGLI
ncbi:hypothetical protein LRP88_11564 [Fusarium phalaenopsidis]